MPLKVLEHEEPVLNLTPMIDVVFLLIIFFMVGARFTELEREFDINLPTVSEAKPFTSPPDDIEINIYHDGKIKVAGRILTLPELEQILKAAQQRFADQSVLIRGDGSSNLQLTIDVLSACDRTEIKRRKIAARVEENNPR